jgi:diguanylate cyclase (GGDEF)-like protein
MALAGGNVQGRVLVEGVANQITNERVVRAGRIVQEERDRAAAGWSEAQDSLAAESGLSLLLVEGLQPPALVISNNNSICQALQSSPEHVALCDPYCGMAHQRALDAGTVTHYRCHAGMHCFAMPVQIEPRRQLAVIGGRALVSSSDYRALAERFRDGDLKDLLSTDLFHNVIFADEADLDHAALRVAAAAREFSPEPRQEKSRQPSRSRTKSKTTTPSGETEDPSTELTRMRTELDRRRNFADSLHGFIERIDASDPGRTYELILSESAELLHANRGSLLVYDESANSLTIKAARGIPSPLAEMGRIPLGEGIAGFVMSEGRAIVTADIEALGGPAPHDRGYKTKSFLSYPIRIGNRKIGVLNLTDKSGGGAYDEVDLSIIESVGPQIALAVERAEWQEKAGQFQLMSITDPLTQLHNRRYLEARLSEEISRSKRYNHPTSFMMIDIDDFKLYNDRHGHQAGDRALKFTAECLISAVRQVDVAARYGGEEFSILMPETTVAEASVIADRIRRKIASSSFPQGHAQPLGAVTVSIGLASFSPALDSAEKIVRAADRALYHAKRQGKNRAYAYSEAPAAKVERQK